ncbi:MAG: hypothetical protein EOO04_30995 [Chitinophagaceae bacterium]|nr:MAG: hypothetical protein EOO04_30995 [Chitinophagaceae bacterium]
MGKDREGVFHPKKGKPSDSRDEGLGLRPTMSPDQLEQDLEMTDKYTRGEDELAENVRLKHVNRNTNKKRDLPKNPADNPSDKAVNESYREDVTRTQPEELPGFLTKETLAELAGHKGTPCISIYIPTHKSGVQVNEQHDVITFKNTLQQAEKELHDRNVPEMTIKRCLKPAYELLSDDEFWKEQSEGLGLFISDGFFKFVKLSFKCNEEVIVNSSFHVANLIEALARDEYFYFLVMSKKQVKFYRADASGMERIPLDELPNGVDDVVRFEEKDGQKLMRMGGPAGNMHGHGAGKPDEKTHIGLYLEEVDDTLWDEVLHGETAPLLLAGIEYMIPIYRSVSDYKYVWPEAVVRGALEHEDDDALYQMAMEKMQPYFNRNYDAAKADYFNKSATALTSDVHSVIIPAAYYGRVQTLFVARNAHLWGSFDELNNQLNVHGTRQANDECLVNKAIIKTIMNGGNVFQVAPEQVPDNAIMAAVLRY